MSINKIRNTYDKARAFTTRPDRLVEAGGFDPSLTKTMTTMQMTSSGTSTDFGDLVESRNLSMATGASSTTRGLFYGGEVSGNSTGVDAITMASTGNAADFGDLTTARGYAGATSNGIRALCFGGNPAINVIDFASIASFGNFTDFGNLSVSRNAAEGVCNPVRAVFAGGTDGTSPSPAFQNVIDFITINSTGNASDFGDLTGNSSSFGVCNTPSGQGLFAGGRAAPSGNASKIGTQTDVINISSAGNATNFGALSVSFRQGASNCNESTGLLCGGVQGPAVVNSVNRFSLQAGGISSDFGDLSRTPSDNAAVSGAHSGIDWGSVAVQRPSVNYMPGSGKVLMMGGNRTGGDRILIDSFQLSTLGNASLFGDLTKITDKQGSAASTVKAICMGGGQTPSSYSNEIQSVTFQSEGNAADFGDLSATYYLGAGCNSTTRAIFANPRNSSNSATNTIEYFTMATAGNASDFGNATVTMYQRAAFSSPVRGVIGGGDDDSSQSNVMDYITIASTGDATDFGDLSQTDAVYGMAALSNSTRGVYGGGRDVSPNAATNIMQYVTIASTGNSTDFGDLTTAREMGGGAANATRGIFIGGRTPSIINTTDFITIASTGNATDFGDMTEGSTQFGCGTDFNGGLQA